jgi:hypothetical protein
MRLVAPAVVLLSWIGSVGCTASSAEVSPPENELFFPTGLAVFAANPRSGLLHLAGGRALGRRRCFTSTASIQDLAGGDSLFLVEEVERLIERLADVRHALVA